ncbi:MAG: hypothetical protein A3K59_04105 [Euryarchaeota archaeon RBG_19FT_COMBO_69_17]|nr:MAG: hypothetical protein A3K59_04105 [Euryarchaeota archaeon RBG_19FT_COMBO_69_17]
MVSFRNPRSRHPYHMHDMIRAQPAFLRETEGVLKDLDVRAFLGSPRSLVLTGCGTSFHAAMYGARVLQEAFGARARVEAVHAYDLLYGPPPPARSTVLGISHSGSTPTTNRALARAARAGSPTLAVVGLPESPMDRVAGRSLVIGTTHDASWANTMSYTTQLAALAFLAIRVGGRPWAPLARAWQALPRRLSTALASEPRVRDLAAHVAGRDRVTFLGSGLDEITALEAALKIRETSGLPAAGYHPEQYLHGPFVAADGREAVVALLSRDDGRRARAILDALGSTGAHVRSLGDGKGADIPLPGAPRLLRPIVSVVPLQFLAYYVAIERKADPDVMRTDVPRYRAGVDLLFT